MAVTQISDVIVPRVFSPYVQLQTQEKTRVIQAGALVRDESIDEMLAGGGITFDMPSWNDLLNDSENISTDQAFGVNDSVPQKTSAVNEVAVRLSRNKSWSSADLTSALAGADPMASIADRVSTYWSRRLQAAFIATIKGIFADNAAAPTGTEHVQNDLTNDISGASFIEGVTSFSAEAFLDTLLTMGDSSDMLGILMTHSVVMNRMLKNDLIEVGIEAMKLGGADLITDNVMELTSSAIRGQSSGAGASTSTDARPRRNAASAWGPIRSAMK